jgi:hypothetical protein
MSSRAKPRSSSRTRTRTRTRTKPGSSSRSIPPVRRMLKSLGLEVVLVDKKTKRIVRRFYVVYRSARGKYYYMMKNGKRKYLTRNQIERCKAGKLKSFRGGVCGGSSEK